jgi:hypothetical protein
VIIKLSVVMLLSLGACAPRRAAPPANESRAPADTISAAAVMLERTPCFGGCPVYTLAVSPLGEVTYQGRAHVRRLGTASSRISRQRVDALLKELDRAGFFTFADKYLPSEPACGRYATDSPSAITTVTHRGRSKTITHDYGCGSAPGALVVLERRIDEVLGSDQWTGR